MPTRQQMWDRLDEPFDVLIIGGGINGAGIARDAARRGLRVALVEMRDLAYGTSSRSSKLIHGGLRYLEQLSFSLVFESVSERRIMLDIAPHLVKPLGFIFPVYKGSRRNLFTVNAGMWLYEGLALFRSPKRHSKFKARELADREPALARDGLKGALLYYDCSTDDARLTLESALDGVEHGAVVATWARATSLIKDEQGRVVGATLEDTLDGGARTVRARVVVNATGPWTDAVRGLGRGEEASAVGPLLRPTKGVHVVVERAKLPVEHAVVCFHPEDGRVLFAIPWGERTYVGTTDTDYQGDPGAAAADLDDVNYLLEACARYFPDHPLGHDDVISTWAGLRPLIAPPSSEARDEQVSESSVSREHQLLVGADGMITIAGGKLTTYRRMSAEVVGRVVDMLRLSGELPSLRAAETDEAPLPGAVGWPEDDDPAPLIARAREAARGLLADVHVAWLVERYGTRGVSVAALVADDPTLAEPIVPGRPEVMAQVAWAVREELAATLEDVLVRRTQLFFRDHDQGLGALDAVADRMGALLGWSEATRARMIDDYHAVVAHSRQWRSASAGDAAPAAAARDEAASP